jgi:hypothetical protein
MEEQFHISENCSETGNFKHKLKEINMLEEFKKELRALFESNTPFAIDEVSPAASVTPPVVATASVTPTGAPPSATQPAPTPTPAASTPGPTGAPMVTPAAPIQEEDEKTTDFLYTGPNGDNYKVTVEIGEEELNVFDKDGKKIDIFTPDMLEINGGLSSETRKALFNYWKTEANKTTEEPAP